MRTSIPIAEAPKRDLLLDTLFARGGTDQIAARIQAHLDAGADHVCLQVLSGPLTQRGALL